MHQAAKRFIVRRGASARRGGGVRVLARGGSAVDAAIAVQMVLGWSSRSSSGIGGGAFLLHWSRRERTLRTYDGRETAPAAARPDRF
jgi:gamma-glutamyltranspeptidase/glutathione hydrolase